MVDYSQPRASGGMLTQPLRTAKQLIAGGMPESSEIVRMARALEAARDENARLLETFDAVLLNTTRSDASARTLLDGCGVLLREARRDLERGDG